MTATPEKLTDILDLERLEVDLFRGRSPHEQQPPADSPWVGSTGATAVSSRQSSRRA
jgi:acyl-CoA thioesterase